MNLFLSRLKIARMLALSNQREQLAARLNPAITATFLSRDPNTGLIKTIAPDGSVGYQRQIFDADLVAGDIVPTTIQAGNSIGFIDGLSQ